MESPPDAAYRLLVEGAAAALPKEALALVLRHVPVPEIARLACVAGPVGQAFQDAWTVLQEHQPGPRYAPPSA